MMRLRRVLFVDDEASVLDALQNMLRKQRKVWDMSFALGGQIALELLAQGSFDVIVTDMRMPGLDGAALLRIVREKYPQIARIVLSGQADRDSVLRAVSVAHQFLSKPCEAEQLKTVIERTCALHVLLQDDAIRRIAGRIDKLPSAPQAYWALSAALNRPDVGLAEIADIVEEDPAMSAKMLQLVNSAYFGLAQRVTSIHQAVMYLGVELLRGLLLTARVFDLAEHHTIRGFSLDRLQAHSLATARVAKRLMKKADLREEVFTAALLHEVGQIVLALGVPDQFAACLKARDVEGISLADAERRTFGTSHCEVGAYLLGVWGLPFSIVEAVAFHQTPGLVTEGSREVLVAVHVADALVEGRQPRGVMVDGGLNLEFLESGGWLADLPGWRTLAAEELDRGHR